jgi:hypothetical protein
MPEANIFEEVYEKTNKNFNIYVVGAATNLNLSEDLRWTQDVNNTRYKLTTEAELGYLAESFGFKIVDQSNFLFIGKNNKEIGRLNYSATLEEMENMFQITLASFEDVRIGNNIDNLILTNEITTLNLENYFYIADKSSVEFDLISNSNPSILSANISGSSLFLEKGSITGNSKIVIQTKIPEKNIAFNTEFFVFNSKGDSEDFEFSSLIESAIPWETSGEWIISDEASYTGDHSIRSYGVRKITLSITLNIPDQDHISFAYKTLTENEQSLLTFYIDSVEANGRDSISLWSGDNDWRKVTYDVSPGIKTFTWEYISPELFPNENSYVWIDAIVLPASGIEISNMVNKLPSTIDMSNYPNPFNPTTTIDFLLDISSNVKLIVYDMSGRVVGRLHDGFTNAGKHSFGFDGSSLSSGIYYAVLSTEEEQYISKMILVK